MLAASVFSRSLRRAASATGAPWAANAVAAPIPPAAVLPHSDVMDRGSDRDWNAEGAAGFAGGPQGAGVHLGGEILE